MLEHRYSSIKTQFDVNPEPIQDAISALYFDEKPEEAAALMHAKYGAGLRAFHRNAFECPPGSGLCIIASRFNHDCLPNCARYYVEAQGPRWWSAQSSQSRLATK